MKKIDILLTALATMALISCNTKVTGDSDSGKSNTEVSTEDSTGETITEVTPEDSSHESTTEVTTKTTSSESGTEISSGSGVNSSESSSEISSDSATDSTETEQLSMDNINAWISTSRPTMVNYLCSYTYPSSNITLHDKSILSIEYGEPIKGKYVSTRERLNTIDSDELISTETKTAYIKGNDYGIFSNGEIEWNRPYDSTFVLHGFVISTDIFGTSKIDTDNNTFVGTVYAGKESLFFNKAVSVTNINLELRFDKNNRLTYLESTFLSEKKASVKVQTNYTYNFVSVTIPE
ncbi:MAG: hypothetical protein SO412_07660 [Erysipelotrichaceae bacterium]|nr:hypothetical protein [Erysipelotrichaceae bacterium]